MVKIFLMQYDLSQPFPSEIPCSTAIEMLNACIKALGGRQLKDGEKQYLAEKMTGLFELLIINCMEVILIQGHYSFNRKIYL